MWEREASLDEETWEDFQTSIEWKVKLRRNMVCEVLRDQVMFQEKETASEEALSRRKELGMFS